MGSWLPAQRIFMDWACFFSTHLPYLHLYNHTLDQIKMVYISRQFLVRGSLGIFHNKGMDQICSNEIKCFALLEIFWNWLECDDEIRLPFRVFEELVGRLLAWLDDSIWFWSRLFQVQIIQSNNRTHTDTNLINKYWRDEMRFSSSKEEKE